jgi:hypothetical protein
MNTDSSIDFASVINAFKQQVMKDLVESPEFVEWMNDYLSNHTIVVEFTKVNGESRRMRCTRNFSMIPDTHHPKENSTRKKPTNSVAAFDLDKMEWRSFIPENITKIEWGHSHDSLH